MCGAGSTASIRRARYLDALADIERTSLDYYATIRSLYRQRREALIRGERKNLPPPAGFTLNGGPAGPSRVNELIVAGDCCLVGSKRSRGLPPMKRRLVFVAVCLCAIGILLPSRPAAAADPAAVVTSLGNEALKVLGKNVDPNLRVARFRQLFSADFDVPGIARFVLGRYWRVATPAQQQEFLKLFTDYIALAYS